MTAIAHTARGYLRTIYLQHRLRRRSDVLRWQRGRIERFLSRHARKASAFEHLSGRPLLDYPVMEKADLMARFAAYNRHGITADAAWAAMGAGETVEGCSVGASTGTSGNRGLYLVCDAERFEWLGVMLAKTLPDAWRRPHRVAIMLPATSRLYDAANESGRLSLSFFDLRVGVDAHLDALAEMRPTCIVAPPKALVHLARSGIEIRPERIYAAAEVLDPPDRAAIEDRFGPVGQIYMATEGLIATSCSAGRLHLCEDLIHVELEPVGDLCTPIITDFTRRTQMMVRYRMNDLVRKADGPCPCGSPLVGLREVAGRHDDAFSFAGPSGPRLVTPDVIRNAIIGADRTIEDFRARQVGPRAVDLVLPVGTAAGGHAKAALDALFDDHGCDIDIRVIEDDLAPRFDRKLRRVERVWSAP